MLENQQCADYLAVRAAICQDSVGGGLPTTPPPHHPSSTDDSAQEPGPRPTDRSEVRGRRGRNDLRLSRLQSEGQGFRLVPQEDRRRPGHARRANELSRARALDRNQPGRVLSHAALQGLSVASRAAGASERCDAPGSARIRIRVHPHRALATTAKETPVALGRRPLLQSVHFVSEAAGILSFGGGTSAGTPTLMIATIRWSSGTPTAARAAGSCMIPPVLSDVPRPSSIARSIMF